MRYLTFTQPEAEAYPICILVPEIRRDDILKAYVTPFQDQGLDPADIVAISLHQDPVKKKTQPLIWCGMSRKSLSKLY